VKKVFITLFIFIIILAIYPHQTNALGEMIDSGDNFSKLGTENNIINMMDIKDVSDTIYNVLLTLGIAVAVIVAGVLGIQFITGSVSTKAKVKDSLIPFIIGCVIIFGSFGIWRALVMIGNKVA